jgi:streptomycin 6-kinase
VPYCKEEVRAVLNEAIDMYKDAFGDAKRYVLHGDLHELNILDDGNRFWGIDPSGMLAPIELECVRFIRNDVRNHPAFGYEARFKLLLDSFSRFVDRDRLIKMFIIDMAYCTFNSTFENELPDETYLDLELIDIAKKMI